MKSSHYVRLFFLYSIINVARATEQTISLAQQRIVLKLNTNLEACQQNWQSCERQKLDSSNYPINILKLVAMQDSHAFSTFGNLFITTSTNYTEDFIQENPVYGYYNSMYLAKFLFPFDENKKIVLISAKNETNVVPMAGIQCGINNQFIVSLSMDQSSESQCEEGKYLQLESGLRIGLEATVGGSENNNWNNTAILIDNFPLLMIRGATAGEYITTTRPLFKESLNGSTIFLSVR